MLKELTRLFEKNTGLKVSGIVLLSVLAGYLAIQGYKNYLEIKHLKLSIKKHNKDLNNGN